MAGSRRSMELEPLLETSYRLVGPTKSSKLVAKGQMTIIHRVTEQQRMVILVSNKKKQRRTRKQKSQTRNIHPYLQTKKKILLKIFLLRPRKRMSLLQKKKLSLLK